MKSAILFGLALAATPALAQPAADPAPATSPGQAPSQETVAAALDLFEGQDIEAQMLATALQMAEASMDATVEARDVDLPADLHEKLRALVRDEVTDMIAELAPTFRLKAAMAYASRFTTDELKELKRLQDHPVMRKVMQETPALMAEIGAISARLSAERGPEIERKAQELVIEWMRQEAASDAPAT